VLNGSSKNMTDPIQAPRNLDKKPLAEAIFELRWALQPTPFVQTSGQSIAQTGSAPPLSDPGFKILVGVFYNSVSKLYPYSQDLPVAQIPENLTPYVVRHQFRASPGGWPVIQLGPGVLTVNDTKGYSWKDFRDRLLYALDKLYACYPRTIALLKPTVAIFRYVNAIPFDYNRSSITAFLEIS
jgi:uncharacterized protein (TIGR04255 family)